MSSTVWISTLWRKSHISGHIVLRLLTYVVVEGELDIFRYLSTFWQIFYKYFNKYFQIYWKIFWVLAGPPPPLTNILTNIWQIFTNILGVGGSSSSSRNAWQIFLATNPVPAFRALTSRFDGDYVYRDDNNDDWWFGSVQLPPTDPPKVEYVNCPFSTLSHQSFEEHRVVSNGLYQRKALQNLTWQNYFFLHLFFYVYILQVGDENPRQTLDDHLCISGKSTIKTGKNTPGSVGQWLFWIWQE